MNLIKCPECAKRCKSVYMVNGRCSWCGYDALAVELIKEVMKPKKKRQKTA